MTGDRFLGLNGAAWGAIGVAVAVVGVVVAVIAFVVPTSPPQPESPSAAPTPAPTPSSTPTSTSTPTPVSVKRWEGLVTLQEYGHIHPEQAKDFDAVAPSAGDEPDFAAGDVEETTGERSVGDLYAVDEGARIALWPEKGMPTYEECSRHIGPNAVSELLNLHERDVVCAQTGERRIVRLQVTKLTDDASLQARATVWEPTDLDTCSSGPNCAARPPA
ncbi:hypothetical protein [Nonomuraea sp. NPDC048826]|uniref:hypothetical protein n=1 Tax=Nonomuraea sp. NPDC048826 TaxID=3364347 RepID=UPI00371C8E8C